MTMSDRIAVMDGGYVLQVGRPEEIYERPATRFVADFIGETNFINGRLTARNGLFATVQMDPDTRFDAALGDTTIAAGDAVTVAIRPEKITLTPLPGVEGHDASLADEAHTTLLDGVVREAIYIGTDTRYVVTIGQGTELIVRIQNFGQRYDTIFKQGERVLVFWDNADARILSE